MTTKGFSHSINALSLRKNDRVQLFGQVFKITGYKKGVVIGTSKIDELKNNQAGSQTASGEHNIICITADEVWREPIARKSCHNV